MANMKPRPLVIEMNHNLLIKRMQQWDPEEIAFNATIASAVMHAARIGRSDEFADRLIKETGIGAGQDRRLVLHSWVDQGWFKDEEPKIIPIAGRILEELISDHILKLMADFRKVIRKKPGRKK